MHLRQRVLFPLKRLRQKEKPYLVFDIETKKDNKNDWLNSLWLGSGVYDGDNYFFCSTAKKLWERLTDPKYAGYILYAHNGSRFDFLFLLEFLYTTPCKIFLRGGRVWIFLNDRIIADSMAVVTVGVAEAAQKLGCHYQKGSIDYDNIENEPWREYLENDCKTEHEIISLFRQKCNSLGAQMGLTAPSTALQLFRLKYQGIPIYNSGYETEWERQAVYGGRTEVFIKEGKDLESFDINSSYSKSAINQKIPYQLTKSFTCNFTTKEPLDYEFYIAEIETEHPYDYFPLFPTKNEKDKTIFPVGKIRGVYTSTEIETFKHYYKNNITYKKINVYNCAPIFKEYAENIYGEKLKGNFSAKLLLNSLYGRFCLRNDNQEIILGDTLENLQKIYGNTVEELSAENSIYGVDSDKFSFCAPFIFAYITADARIRLWEQLQSCGKSAYYCDTDSIYTTSGGKFNIGNNIGEWKKEGEYKRARFIAPKVYELDNKIKAKGFLHKKGKNLPEYILNGEEFEQQRTIGFREALRKNIKSLTLTKNTKRLLLKDEKRIFKGKYSEPFVMR